MVILGIHSGHCASACLFADDRIVAMASEERFTRKKNQSGFPIETVAWLASQYSLDGGKLDAVAVAEHLAQVEELHWHGDAWEGFASRVSRIVPASIITSNALVRPYVSIRQRLSNAAPKFARLLEPFGVDASRIRFIEHHECHAHAAYWLDPRRRPDGETLVVTLDNTGDGLCGTVNVAGPDRFERVAAFQSLRSVGMLYTAVTRLLGMKPVEHEYKVMGMAPYARRERADAVYDRLRTCIDLTGDGLTFVNHRGLGESAYVRKLGAELAGFRFDDIAGGAQKLVEELVLKFLKAWSQKTGLRKLAVGGGVFMNVKLNMLINQSGDFDEPFFLPSCGDEHNAAGAALRCAWDLSRQRGESFKPAPLRTLGLGPAYSREQVRREVAGASAPLEWKRVEDVEAVTAAALSGGLIVGRLRGHMEFGARSLGNRSILARPDDYRMVHDINRAVKMRDFWMPFAPTILWERRNDYIINENDSPAPFMILGFHSTDRAVRDLIAGLHPYDLTCRPQLLERNANPYYYDLIKRFESLTGIGGVLNTSFNLHGEPVVHSPEEAIRAYRLSGLDLLTIEDYVVWDPGRVRPAPDGGAAGVPAGAAARGRESMPFVRVRERRTRPIMRVTEPGPAATGS